MKIALVQPPYYFYSRCRDDAHRYDVPLGLTALAGAAGNGHDIDIINLNFPGERKKLNKQYDAAGIHCSSMDRDYTVALARGLKKSKGRSFPVIVGGPHATLAPQDLLKESAVDYVFRGAAERSFPAFLNALESGAPVRDIEGLCLRERGKMHLGCIAEIADLDALPPVDYAALPLDRYLRQNDGIITYETSRGCIHKCLHCTMWKMNRKLRARDLKKVMPDLERIFRLHNGIRGIRLVDNTLNYDRARFLRFCRGFKELRERLKRPVTWSGLMRPEHIDGTMAEAMEDSGTRGVLMGLETANDRSLRLLRRNYKAEDILRQVEILLRHGITVRASFMLGLPWETEDEMWNTVRFAVDLEKRGALSCLFKLTYFPGIDLTSDTGNSPGASIQEYSLQFPYNRRISYEHPCVSDAAITAMLNYFRDHKKLNFVSALARGHAGRAS